ncbi:hypothetical protein [Pseudomonas putida]|uniref:hypothetical protein n=1 Tax=Pseudomonas putida TaxID=303 RepID=UPI00265B343A|nr:hypothetical protein [Pseudomonas putida]MCZ9636832.1 hypothetical protein [Pseudomonas putida]
MPTENRSSNTEMVSVPRQQLQAWQERFSKSQMFQQSTEIQAALAQQSPQPQAEPVALPERQPITAHGLTALDSEAEGWNACLDEIAKLGPLYTRPAPVGEQEPFAWFVESPQECEYVEGVARTQEDANKYAAAGWSITPMFRRADPGEVERLRVELDEWKNRCQYNADTAHDVARERDTMRAQLAERDALLARVVNSGALSSEQHEELEADCCAVVDVVHQIKRQAFHEHLSKCAALSASAEPASTAWRCEPCKVEMADQRPCDLCSAEPINDLCAEGAHEFVPFRGECVKCGEPYRAEPSAPKCETCNGTSMVDDGEITCSEGGIPYENGPVKCVKDCPDCKPSAPTPMPDYMEAACDKFDWTPEEALRFYAEGKHFDIDNGRTRILCTGAIASHALKGMGGEYADMKGAEPSAPVERDERAAFDLWFRKEKGLHPETDTTFIDSAFMPYRAWQARAALERKPFAHIPEGYCVMPRRLTAENGAKALLLGEFKLKVTQECPECSELDEPIEGCEICDGAGEYGQRHMIPWDKIKFIYSEAVKGLALHPKAPSKPS